MITAGDSGDIVAGLVNGLGLPVYQDGNQKDYSTADRIIIHTDAQTREDQWLKNFINVNVVVQDEGNEAMTGKLKDYERKLMGLFYERVVGEREGVPYMISLTSLGIEEDSSLKAHYVNLKLLFEALR